MSTSVTKSSGRSNGEQKESKEKTTEMVAGAAQTQLVPEIRYVGGPKDQPTAMAGMSGVWMSMVVLFSGLLQSAVGDRKLQKLRLFWVKDFLGLSLFGQFMRALKTYAGYTIEDLVNACWTAPENENELAGGDPMHLDKTCKMCTVLGQIDKSLSECEDFSPASAGLRSNLMRGAVRESAKRGWEPFGRVTITIEPFYIHVMCVLSQSACAIRLSALGSTDGSTTELHGFIVKDTDSPTDPIFKKVALNSLAKLSPYSNSRIRDVFTAFGFPVMKGSHETQLAHLKVILSALSDEKVLTFLGAISVLQTVAIAAVTSAVRKNLNEMTAMSAPSQWLSVMGFLQSLFCAGLSACRAGEALLRSFKEAGFRGPQRLYFLSKCAAMGGATIVASEGFEVAFLCISCDGTLFLERNALNGFWAKVLRPSWTGFPTFYEQLSQCRTAAGRTAYIFNVDGCVLYGVSSLSRYRVGGRNLEPPFSCHDLSMTGSAIELVIENPVKAAADNLVCPILVEDFSSRPSLLGDACGYYSTFDFDDTLKNKTTKKRKNVYESEIAERTAHDAIALLASVSFNGSPDEGHLPRDNRSPIGDPVFTKQCYGLRENLSNGVVHSPKPSLLTSWSDRSGNWWRNSTWSRRLLFWFLLVLFLALAVGMCALFWGKRVKACTDSNELIPYDALRPAIFPFLGPQSRMTESLQELRREFMSNATEWFYDELRVLQENDFYTNGSDWLQKPVTHAFTWRNISDFYLLAVCRQRANMSSTVLASKVHAFTRCLEVESAATAPTSSCPFEAFSGDLVLWFVSRFAKDSRLWSFWAFLASLSTTPWLGTFVLTCCWVLWTCLFFLLTTAWIVLKFGGRRPTVLTGQRMVVGGFRVDGGRAYIDLPASPHEQVFDLSTWLVSNRKFLSEITKEAAMPDSVPQKCSGWPVSLVEISGFDFGAEDTVARLRGHGFRVRNWLCTCHHVIFMDQEGNLPYLMLSVNGVGSKSVTFKLYSRVGTGDPGYCFGSIIDIPEADFFAVLLPQSYWDSLGTKDLSRDVVDVISELNGKTGLVEKVSVYGQDPANKDANSKFMSRGEVHRAGPSSVMQHHTAWTRTGWSGSPMFLGAEKRWVGMHVQASNQGHNEFIPSTLIDALLSEMPIVAFGAEVSFLTQKRLTTLESNGGAAVLIDAAPARVQLVNGRKLVYKPTSAKKWTEVVRECCVSVPTPCPLFNERPTVCDHTFNQVFSAATFQPCKLCKYVPLESLSPSAKEVVSAWVQTMLDGLDETDRLSLESNTAEGAKARSFSMTMGTPNETKVIRFAPITSANLCSTTQEGLDPSESAPPCALPLMSALPSLEESKASKRIMVHPVPTVKPSISPSGTSSAVFPRTVSKEVLAPIAESKPTLTAPRVLNVAVSTATTPEAVTTDGGEEKKRKRKANKALKAAAKAAAKAAVKESQPKFVSRKAETLPMPTQKFTSRVAVVPPPQEEKKEAFVTRAQFQKDCYICKGKCGNPNDLGKHDCTVCGDSLGWKDSHKQQMLILLGQSQGMWLDQELPMCVRKKRQQMGNSASASTYSKGSMPPPAVPVVSGPPSINGALPETPAS